MEADISLPPTFLPMPLWDEKKKEKALQSRLLPPSILVPLLPLTGVHWLLGLTCHFGNF